MPVEFYLVAGLQGVSELLGRLTLQWLFAYDYSHHRAVAYTVCGLESNFADGAITCCARISINDSVWVDSGTVSVGFLTSDVIMLIERVLEDRDGNLFGLLPDPHNWDFNLESLLDSAGFLDFLRDLHGHFFNIRSGNLDLVKLFSHFLVLHFAGNLFLFAFVNDLNTELLFDFAVTASITSSS